MIHRNLVLAHSRILLLTNRAPEADPSVGRVFLPSDRSGAAAAGFACAAIDPQELLAVRAAGGAVVAGSFGHVGQEEFARGADEIGELRLRQRGDFAERTDATREGALGFEDIAESGKHSLTEE